MIEINISVIVRQRDAIPKELSRGRPPYSPRFNTKRNELDPTSRQLMYALLPEQCSCCTAGCGGGALRALLLLQCT